MSYREIVQNLRDTLEDALDCKIHSEPRIAAAIALLAEADALLAKPAPEPHLTDDELREIHHIEEFGLFCDADEFIDIARHIERVVLNRVLYTAPPDLQKRVEELERQLEEAQKDAGRYRWLRDQHEGLMPMEIDADGDLMPRELRALAFTVFYPDPSERESLVPVPIGDLDETIDAAIKENHAD